MNEKLYNSIQKFWMGVAYTLGVMAFTGIVFMSYQVFINGVTI